MFAVSKNVISMNTKTILKTILTLMIIIIIVGYSYNRSKDFITGPTIEILSPKTGIGVSESLLEVKGTANNISYISINDRQIFTDENGNFKEKLLLFPGYNIISVKASDKFDRKTEKTLEIIYKTQNMDTKNTSTATTTPKYNIKSADNNASTTINKKLSN